MQCMLRNQRLITQLGQTCAWLRQSQPLYSTAVTSDRDTGLSLSYDENIAVIRMDKGDNRLNEKFLNIFHDFLGQVEKNESIHGLMTTGCGKFYCNGLDLDWMGSLSASDLTAFMKSFVHFVKRLLYLPLPTLAAMNGHTFAGGSIMAFAQDFRVMNSDKGWVCFNGVLFDKRIFDIGSFLSAKVGSGLNANDAFLFGRRYTATEALSHRLIHSTASSSDLVEHSSKLLRSYLGKNGFKRETMRKAKHDLYHQFLPDFDRLLKNLEFASQFMNEAQLAELKTLKLK